MIEVLSQVASILSFAVAIIWLLLIKPIYKYFKQEIKIEDKSNFKNNKWKIEITNNTNNYNTDIVENITLN